MPTWLKKLSWTRHPVLTDSALYVAVIAFVLLAYGITNVVSRSSN